MKKTIIIAAAAVGIVAFVGFVKPKKPETTNVSLSEANIVWTGKKVSGGKHTGTLEIKESNFEFTSGQLSGGKVEVDMQSLQSTDLEGEWKEKLEGHLISADFFSTESYPLATLIITSVRPGESTSTYEVTGELTIKETTLSESFPVTMEKAGDETIFTAQLEIDRTNYDVKYGSSKFFEGLGDKAIKNQFKLEVRIAISNQEQR